MRHIGHWSAEGHVLSRLSSEPAGHMLFMCVFCSKHCPQHYTVFARCTLLSQGRQSYLGICTIRLILQAAYRTCGGGASGGGRRQTLPRWMPRWTLRKWLQMPGAGRGRLQGCALLSNMHVVTCIVACKGTFSSIASKEAIVA